LRFRFLRKPSKLKLIGKVNMLSLGLDVGTTGCKATAIDNKGRIVSFAYESYNLIIPGKGMSELNGDIVWESVKSVLKVVASECKKDIKAIAVASFGESFVCLDDEGKSIGNSILFSDFRGTDEIEDILKVIDKKELFEITGMPINSMYSLNKLLWMKKNTKTYEDAKYIMLYGDFITYKLSGNRRIDFSLASRTMMFDYKNKSWASKLMNKFDIDSNKFSKPIAPGDIIGKISIEMANEIGLSEDVILVAGGHDQICAALGAGVIDACDSVDGMGTSECITTVLSDKMDTDFMLENNFCIEPYAIEGKYVTLAFNPAAGASINWYRKTIEKTRDSAFEKTGESIFAAMEKECPDEPSTVMMVPYLAGTGTPYMDSNASGAILGLKVSTQRGEIYKACLEGICFDIMLNAKLLADMGTAIKKLICVGGVTKSDMLMQIKADSMGTPITRLKVKESGTMGLAMLCFVALGEFESFEKARVLVQTEKTFEPNEEKHKIYLNSYEKYKRAYKGLKNIDSI